jgi:hypothetical protein
MKLQIEGQSLRVRIGEQELAMLLAGQPLEMRTEFAGAFAMSCALLLESTPAASLSGSAQAWRISLPRDAVEAHAERLPTREGLHFQLGGTLELLFDVDVRDSVRQRRPR